MEGYKQVKEKMDMNSMVHQKEDVENPIFRVDALVEKISPRQLFEGLKDYAQIPSWFSKCIHCKVIGNLSKDEEVYSTVLKAAYPLNGREIILWGGFYITVSCGKKSELKALVKRGFRAHPYRRLTPQ